MNVTNGFKEPDTGSIKFIVKGSFTYYLSQFSRVISLLVTGLGILIYRSKLYNLFLCKKNYKCKNIFINKN